MMIGELPHSHPTVQIPPQWDPFDDLTASETHSPFSLSSGNSLRGARHALSSSPIGSPDYPFTMPEDSFGSLQRYLPSNESVFDPDSDMFDDELADLIPLDAFSCDTFRMYEFKVRRCTRGRSHDWTECPFAHPGEKARRRDPRKYGYSGTACPEFRKGSCRRGDSCEFAHGVFECWLHPDRYRTQACKDGLGCRRRICFFAHTPEQLRVANLHSPRTSFNSPDSYDGSPLRRSFDSYLSNPGSNLVVSPPVSPPSSPPMSPLLSSSYNEVLSGMRQLQLAKANLSPSAAVGWGLSGVGSPRGGSSLRPGYYSLPSTPTRIPTRSSGFNQFDQCVGSGVGTGEEPVMERVESGRDLRAKIYAKLCKENSFGPVSQGTLTDPDVGWISDLVE